jgi:hypothetical protein
VILERMMATYKQVSGWALALTIVVSGCNSSSDSAGDGGGGMDQLAHQVTAQKAAGVQQDESAAQEAKSAAAADQPPAEQPKTAAGREGVGEGGYYTAIVGARRHVLNRVEDLAWTQGVQHFQAEHGRLPKDHAEFMSRVVEPLQLDLGYKEENQEFLYDPTQGQWGEVFVVEKMEQPAP